MTLWTIIKNYLGGVRFESLMLSYKPIVQHSSQSTVKVLKLCFSWMNYSDAKSWPKSTLRGRRFRSFMSVLKYEYVLAITIFLSRSDDDSDPDLYQARTEKLRSRVCVHKETYAMNCLGHLSRTVPYIQNLNLLFIWLPHLVCLPQSPPDIIISLHLSCPL